uniref:Uncharacterized protein n=3 Tax=Aegilops tauschii subsp. strangulata TaxID=200361 RepID=A0A453FIM1_AEGTS
PAAAPKKAHMGDGSVPEKSGGDCTPAAVGCSRGKDELGPPLVFVSSPHPCCLHGQAHVIFFLALHGTRCRWDLEEQVTSMALVAALNRQGGRSAHDL